MHCKNTSVTCTPNLLYAHTKWGKGVSIEQIWCAGHTNIFTVCSRANYSSRYVTFTVCGVQGRHC